MKENIIFWSILVIIFCIWVFGLYWLTDAFDIETIILSIFLTICTLLLIVAIRSIIWRIQNGVDVFATLESKEEDVKEHMLFIMQYGHSGGFVGAVKEFNKIFRNYPQWNLTEWEVFRAWYKYEIDLMLKYTHIYELKNIEDGSPYRKEYDSLYDPNAPDWAQFDRDHSHDDDEYDIDDKEDDDDFVQDFHPMG